MFKRILVCIDGSGLALQAVGVAASLAQQNHSDVVLLHVQEYAPNTTFTVAWQIGTQGEVAGATLPSLMHEPQRILHEAGVGTEVITTQGVPNSTILSIAQERGIDLIVLGSRGASNTCNQFLGGVSDYVAHHAACPVLIVR